MTSELLQVKLLKDVLEEWKKEVDKKPPEMSVDEAYDALGLKTGVGGYVGQATPIECHMTSLSSVDYLPFPSLGTRNL